VLVYDTTVTNNYDFALIQYNNISTVEQYNFGIIIKDNNGNTLSHIPKISIATEACIDLKNKAAINYTLSQIREEIEDNGTIKEGYISDSLSVSMYRSLTTEKTLDKALESLVFEYVTLKKFRTIDKSIKLDKYDKRSIAKLMRNYAADKNIQNFRAHFESKITIKPIDLSLIDEEENPYSIATVTSPHIENFQDSLITNIFTLQEAKRKGIENMFLHIPVYKDIKTKNLAKHIGLAKEQAKEYGLELEQDNRAESIMERLETIC